MTANTSFVVPAPRQPSIPVAGEAGTFPVRRIWCVGRNYLEHIREMGNDERDPPFFFAKHADMIVPDGATVPYPPLTRDLHHEVELVVALKSGGLNIPADKALDHVYGYAVGIDLTRRDLQQASRKKERPWEIGKSFDNSAPCGALQPAGRTMIAFSSDRNVAAPGIYLLSFLPGEVVERTTAYAISLGHSSIAAIVPQGNYGAVVEKQLRQTLLAHGGTLTGVARYSYDDASVAAAVEEIAPAIKEATAIYVPDGGATPKALVGALRRAGVDLSGKIFLGTGQWTSADLSDPAFKGALYADLDQSDFGRFKERYKQAYGKAPTLNAGIGYDAVALVAGIVKQRGAGGLNQAALESLTGFIGTTGVFRFNRDGTTDRALAVYRVGASGTEIASPAPKRFGFRGS